MKVDGGPVICELEGDGERVGMLTAVFHRGCCQLEALVKAIDWLHWSQLLEVSTEAANRHTGSQTHTLLTLFLA